MEQQAQAQVYVGAAQVVGLGSDPFGHAAELSAELIEMQVKELHKEVEMLQRSNDLLREEEPGDQVIEQAIMENEEIIGRKQARIAELERQMKEQFPHFASSSSQGKESEEGVHMGLEEEKQAGPVGLYL
jgi:hypothetical protein